MFYIVSSNQQQSLFNYDYAYPQSYPLLPTPLSLESAPSPQSSLPTESNDDEDLNELANEESDSATVVLFNGTSSTMDGGEFPFGKVFNGLFQANNRKLLLTF